MAIKTMIKLETEIPENQQRLYVNGVELADDKKCISDYYGANGIIIDVSTL